MDIMLPSVTARAPGTSGAPPASEESADAARLRVGYAGPSPWWHSLPDPIAELQPVAISHVDLRTIDSPLYAPPHVLHVSQEALGKVGVLRRSAPASAIVADLTEAPDIGPRLARRLEDADLVVVGSLDALRELRRRFPRLARRSALLRPPVDLERFAPEAELEKTRGRDLRRFRRLHRLVGPAVLYAGPYTESGGLASLLDAVYALRSAFEPALRLCAVPIGPVDRRFLDRVERRALRLGHHGLIEWTLDEDDLPLWLACASIVCVPATDGLVPESAALAGAAGRPFVCCDVDDAREHVVDGETGCLVPPVEDPEQLARTLWSLLGNDQASVRIGASARARALAHLSPAAAGSRLRQLWADVAASRAAA